MGLETNNEQYSTFPVNLKIEKYNIEIRKPLESEDWELENQRLQIVVEYENKKYYADFITPEYLSELFKENLPETQNYLAGRDRIIVKNLNKKTIESTLEDILLNWHGKLEYYFHKKNIL